MVAPAVQAPLGIRLDVGGTVGGALVGLEALDGRR
jgi:hypothetical protein